MADPTAEERATDFLDGLSLFNDTITLIREAEAAAYKRGWEDAQAEAASIADGYSQTAVVADEIRKLKPGDG